MEKLMITSRHTLLFLGILWLLASCTAPLAHDTTMNGIAEEYVQLVLAFGIHEPGYVDAYYGPEAWREEAKSQHRSLPDIKNDLRALAARLEMIQVSAGNEPAVRRKAYLRGQIDAFIVRLRMREGEKFTFDEEARLLYNADPPHHDDAHFQAIIDRLDALLPGEGPLRDRHSRFMDQFIIPPESLANVFSVAIEEARRRTQAYLELPEGESFRIEYVTDQPWGGYNWYQGDMHSLIQINTDLPQRLSSAVGLAAHEGYPGHHVLNLLMEKELVNKRGWVEYSIFPLQSPLAIVAEGSGNFGIQMAFPGQERVAFERDVLMPLAGLDPNLIGAYHNITSAMKDLKYAGNEAARGYLDGYRTREETIEWLQMYALASPERAEKSLAFYDTYGAYVINYNLGQDIVSQWIESQGGTPDNPIRRWELFGQLISAPRLAGDLK